MIHVLPFEDRRRLVRALCGTLVFRDEHQGRRATCPDCQRALQRFEAAEV